MKTSFLNDQRLPVVVNQRDNESEMPAWTDERKEEVRALLSEYGAILFRGFPVHNVNDFEKLAEGSTSNQWVEYLEATSPRDHVERNTSTSTKYDKNRTIFFHNEKSYSSVWPKHLFFYCDLPSAVGGETPLADCRALYNDIPEDILAKFQEKKLMYVRRFSNNLGIPWKKAFGVESKEELEKYCEANHIDDLSWSDDGTPVLRYVRATSINHPVTGDKCWFNHGTFFNAASLEPEIREFFLTTFGAAGLPYNTFYGDGSEIEVDVVAKLRELYEKHSVSFKWQASDVLLIDNMLVAHGRRPFEGERNILVTMTDAVSYSDIQAF